MPISWPVITQAVSTQTEREQLSTLVFLNRCYWPDTEATGQLLTDLLEHLAADYQVHVVCGQPNRPKAGENYLESGVQVHGGVTIHRLRHTRFAKHIPAGRMFNLVSFAFAAGRYLKRCRLRPDIVISETDPFLLPPVAARYAQRVNAKLLCYVQDIYPDVAEAIGKAPSQWVSSSIRNRLRRTYSSAEKLVVLGSCMSDRLVQSPWGIDPDKLVLVPNWADCDAIQPQPIGTNAFRSQHQLVNRFVVMHSGNMGLTQCLEVLVDATQKPAWPTEALLLLVGDGVSKIPLQRRVAGLQHPDRVRFMPYQPREQLSSSLSGADLHVVSMHESITGCLCPSKLYGILAAGRPTLAIGSPQTDLCRTVKSHNVGWCLPPGDAEAIARAVAVAASDPIKREAIGKRARLLALSNYDRDGVLDRFNNLLQAMLNSESKVTEPRAEAFPVHPELPPRQSFPHG